MIRRTEVTGEPNAYEPPAVERVIEHDEIEREVQYAGEASPDGTQT
jgi:hypothetical protein